MVIWRLQEQMGLTALHRRLIGVFIHQVLKINTNTIKSLCCNLKKKKARLALIYLATQPETWVPFIIIILQYSISYILYTLLTYTDYKPRSLASSTRIISTSKCLGERLMTLWTVRSSVLHASLWNTMTMLVLGRSSEYTLVLQLTE